MFLGDNVISIKSSELLLSYSFRGIVLSEVQENSECDVMILPEISSDLPGDQTVSEFTARKVHQSCCLLLFVFLTSQLSEPERRREEETWGRQGRSSCPGRRTRLNFTTKSWCSMTGTRWRSAGRAQRTSRTPAMLSLIAGFVWRSEGASCSHSPPCRSCLSTRHLSPSGAGSSIWKMSGAAMELSSTTSASANVEWRVRRFQYTQRTCWGHFHT